MKWRKLFRAVHRDTGYIVAALTIAYVISGIAVNHIADWNPSYKFTDDQVNVGPLPSGSYKQMQDHVVAALSLDPKKVKGHFMESETEFRVFLENSEEVRVDVATGQGTRKRVVKRTFLFEVNALHLNTQKGIWTWIADLFAISLLLLVITGLFMMKGERGIGGRGKWFVTAGTAIPVIFVLHMYLGCSDGLRSPPYSDKHANFTVMTKERKQRMTHIEGGQYKLTSHYRKTSASPNGIELCRVSVSGRYREAKAMHRNYRLDLYALPKKALTKSRYKVTTAAADGAFRMTFEMDGHTQYGFESGRFTVKKLKFKNVKGLVVASELGATFDVKHEGKRFLGAFYVAGGTAQITGKCDVPKPKPKPDPMAIPNAPDAGVK